MHILRLERTDFVIFCLLDFSQTLKNVHALVRALKSNFLRTRTHIYIHTYTYMYVYIRSLLCIYVMYACIKFTSIRAHLDMLCRAPALKHPKSTPLPTVVRPEFSFVRADLPKLGEGNGVGKKASKEDLKSQDEREVRTNVEARANVCVAA